MSWRVSAVAMLMLGLPAFALQVSAQGAVGGVATPALTGSYESQRLALFLRAAGLEEDPTPEGKRIAYVRFERREVFEKDDLRVPLILPSFASTWPNAFHWLTREARIRRELLLAEGDAYSQRLAEESMRNLRDLQIIALVRIVAVKTADPYAVGLVVYTRDIWSLRLEQNFAGAGGTFAISGQLVERNFLGRGESLALRGTIDPLRFTAGQTFADPRLFGALSVYESFDLIWNRNSLRTEGSTGTLSFGRPFYNLAQRTAFRLYAFYADYVFRDTRSGAVVGYDISSARRGQQCGLGSDDCVARVWHEQRLQLSATFDYRVGERYKQTFTGGLEVSDRQVSANAETALRPEQAAVFEQQVLPKVRRDIYPVVRYRLWLPDFVVFTNLASFGQSENVRVGPAVDGSIAVPLQTWGASSDGLILHGFLGYVWAEHDAMVDVAGEGFARLENGRVVDQRGILRLRGATPSWPSLLGRFVLRVVWDIRQNDTQRTFVALGGDNGLRGYPAQQFYGFGARRLFGNVEYRTQPWLLESVHLGAVVFYDAGTVYQRFSNARFHHAAGVGLRVLFPQLNRTVFRLDLGAGLDSPGLTAQITYGSEQLVPLTAAEDELAAADASASVRQSL
ncbi:MAG: hypothetical protein ABW321_17245 [Polyangiales bacterium]